MADLFADLGFSPPIIGGRQPKILLFGGPGTGKTYMALSSGTKEAPAILLDTEGGSHFYGDGTGHFFVRKDTQNIMDALRVADALLKRTDPSPLVVDSGTILWKMAQEGYCAKKKIDDPAFGDWRKIKAPFERLYSRLMAMPRPVIITAHEAENVDQEGKAVKKNVDEPAKPVFEKRAAHVMDICLRLSVRRRVRIAEVYKSRIAALPVGDEIENPTYARIIELAGVYGGAPAAPPQPVEDYDATVARVADDYTDNIFRDETLRALRAVKSMEEAREIVTEAVKKTAAVDGWLHDLKEVMREVVDRLGEAQA